MMVEPNGTAPSSPIERIDAAIEALMTFAEDRAFAETIMRKMRGTGLAHRLGIPAPPPPRTELPRCVRGDAVTAIQVAIWDNGESNDRRAKRGPTQYAATIEVWTASADEIDFGSKKDRGRKPNHAFKTDSTLYDRAGLRAHLRALAKPNRTYPVDANYLSELLALTEKGSVLDEPGQLFGLIGTSISKSDPDFRPGTIWHPMSFIMLEITGGRASNAFVALDGHRIDLGAFVTERPDGKPLNGKIIGQSRTDLVGVNRGTWATNHDAPGRSDRAST